MTFSKLILIILLFASFNCFAQVKIISKWDDGSPEKLLDYHDYSDTTKYRIVEFSETGDTILVSSYEDNKRNGITRDFYYNGQKRSEISYKNDRVHGIKIYWYPEGSLWFTSDYREGKLIDTTFVFYESGSLLSTFVNNMDIKECKFYHKNGKLWKTGTMHDGDKTDMWTYYFDNGVKAAQVGYKYDMRHGEYTRFYKSGEILETGKYESNLIINCVRYLKNGDVDKELTQVFNERKNNTPWIDIEREDFISTCTEEIECLNLKEADNYCYCFLHLFDLKWSFDKYLQATEQDYKDIINEICTICNMN